MQAYFEPEQAFSISMPHTNADGILFFKKMFCISLTLIGNFMSLMSSFLAKSLSAFVIFPGLRATGCRYLTKHHLKHSLSSILGILIKPFLGWSNSFGNLIQLLPSKGLYFEILILWSVEGFRTSPFAIWTKIAFIKSTRFSSADTQFEINQFYSKIR